MRRILVICQLLESVPYLGSTYLQVIHPDEDLGLYALLRVPLGPPIFDDLTNVVW
jgi:hypothetical protein